MADKDHYQISILSWDNHETWFQDMSFKLHSKEMFYVVETIIREYAWIKRVISTTGPHTKRSKSTSSEESNIGKLTSKFEDLSGMYNLHKRDFEPNQARAFHIISMSLGEDIKGTRGEYELDIKGFWRSLKVKYQKMSQLTASIYLTNIQTFACEAEKGIFVT
jgi:hypothetical protein